MRVNFARDMVTVVIAVCTVFNTIGIIQLSKEQKPDLYGEYTTPQMKEGIVVKGKDFKPLNIPLDVNLQEFTYALCQVYGMNYGFVLAVMEQESGFNPYVAHEGNYGLMQINEVNILTLQKNLGISDIQDPYNNIRAGVYMLHSLFEKYGDKEKVLMAYNIGEGGAKLLWSKGIYYTNYTNAIAQKHAKYRELLGK